MCGDLRLGDARRGTSGHQVWDVGMSKTGRQGTCVFHQQEDQDNGLTFFNAGDLRRVFAS